MLEWILSGVLILIAIWIFDILCADEVHIRITVNGIDKIKYDKENISNEDEEEEE